MDSLPNSSVDLRSFATTAVAGDRIIWLLHQLPYLCHYFGLFADSCDILTTMGEAEIKSVGEIEKRLTCAPPETPVAYTIAEIMLEAVKKPDVKFTTISEILKKLQELVPVFRLLKNGLIVSSFGELFIRHITRLTMFDTHYGEVPDYLRAMVKKGEEYQSSIMCSKQKIAKLCHPFIVDGHIVMTHSYSRVVFEVLKLAAQKEKQFEVLVTESRPENSGKKMVQMLRDEGIPCTLIYDAQVGCMMERVDVVLVGAESVVESGGIINKIGSYGMAICARELNKPFYVLAESFKFSRCYPLDQTDLERMLKEGECPIRDYTPPAYIRLLFTDLGILTPSAVSDELIKIYS